MAESVAMSEMLRERAVALMTQLAARTADNPDFGPFAADRLKGMYVPYALNNNVGPHVMGEVTRDFVESSTRATLSEVVDDSNYYALYFHAVKVYVCGARWARLALQMGRMNVRKAPSLSCGRAASASKNASAARSAMLSHL